MMLSVRHLLHQFAVLSSLVWLVESVKATTDPRQSSSRDLQVAQQQSRRKLANAGGRLEDLVPEAAAPENVLELSGASEYNVTVVKSTEDLAAALQAGAEHIEVQQHLLLRSPNLAVSKPGWRLQIPSSVATFRGNCTQPFPPAAALGLPPFDPPLQRKNRQQCLLVLETTTATRGGIVLDQRDDMLPRWVDGFYVRALGADGFGSTITSFHPMWLTGFTLQGRGDEDGDGMVIDAPAYIQGLLMTDWHPGTNNGIFDTNYEVSVAYSSLQGNGAAQSVLRAINDVRLEKVMFTDNNAKNDLFTYNTEARVYSDVERDVGGWSTGVTLPLSEAPNGTFLTASDWQFTAVKQAVKLAPRINTSGKQLYGGILQDAFFAPEPEPAASSQGFAPEPAAGPFAENLPLPPPPVDSPPAQKSYSVIIVVAAVVVALGCVIMAAWAFRRAWRLRQHRRRAAWFPTATSDGRDGDPDAATTDGCLSTLPSVPSLWTTSATPAAPTAGAPVDTPGHTHPPLDPKLRNSLQGEPRTPPGTGTRPRGLVLPLSPLDSRSTPSSNVGGTASAAGISDAAFGDQNLRLRSADATNSHTVSTSSHTSSAPAAASSACPPGAAAVGYGVPASSPAHDVPLGHRYTPQSVQSQPYDGPTFTWASAGGQLTDTQPLAQPPAGAPEADLKEYLDSQLDFLVDKTVLGNLTVLGGLRNRVHGGQATVQAVEERRSGAQYVCKFFLSAGAFEEEKALYVDPNKPLGRFLPELHSIVEGAAGGLLDAQGAPLPPCIVMERGEALDVWIQNSGERIDLFTGLQVLSHISERLASLHDSGYVHRDIKPGNIMWLPRKKRWTLIDFGCAARIGTHPRIGFSLFYAAPEALAAYQAGEQTMLACEALDAWSLGVLAIEMFTGKPVFDRMQKKDETIEMILGKRKAPWESHTTAPEIMKPLGNFKRGVLGLLQRDPYLRMTMSEFKSETLKVLANTTVTTGV